MPGTTEPDDEREDGDERDEEETNDGGGELAIYEPPSKKSAADKQSGAPAEPDGPDAEDLAAQCDRMRDRDERIRKARVAVARAEALWIEAKDKASNLKAVYEETVTHLLEVIDDAEEPSLFDGKGGAQAAGDDAWQDADLDAMNVGRLMAPSTVAALREASLDTYRKIGVWCQRNRLTDITGIGKGKAEQVQAALDRCAAQHAKPASATDRKEKSPKVDRSADAPWKSAPIEKIGLQKRVEEALKATGIDTVGKLDEALRTPKRLDGVPRLKPADIEVIRQAMAIFHRHTSGESDDAWRSESITVLGLPTPIVAALSDAGITTLGELEDYRARKPLVEIQRIGEKSVEEIEGALLRYWARRKRAA